MILGSKCCDTNQNRDTPEDDVVKDTYLRQEMCLQIKAFERVAIHCDTNVILIRNPGMIFTELVSSSWNLLC